MNDRITNQRPSDSESQSNQYQNQNQNQDQYQSQNQQRGMVRRYEPQQGMSRYGYGSTSSPFELMRRFTEDVDRMFNSFGFSNFGWPSETGIQPAQSTGTMGTWYPSVDVATKGDDLVVMAELPGIKPEDVQIEADENGLVIKGESRFEQENQDKEQGYWYSERQYGSFYRRIPLPQGAKTENAKAQFNNGILEITLPGAARAITPQRRRIEIEGASKQQPGQGTTQPTNDQSMYQSGQQRPTSP